MKKVNCWTPVEKGLPEESTDVFVTCVYPDEEEGDQVSIETCYFNKTFGFTKGYVVAWMAVDPYSVK